MSAAWVLGGAWGLVAAWPLLARSRRLGPRGRAAGLRAGRVPTAGRPHRWRCGARPAPLAVVLRVLAAPRAQARRRAHARAVERALPLCLDVLTMAARAGFTPRLAVAATAAWSPPAIGDALRAVETRCRLGSSFGDALRDLARAEPALAPAAEALAVADRSGAPAAGLLGRLAGDARAGVRRRAEAHARRVPVRLLFPLVFLVLPAFGLLTVVPTLAAGLRGS